MIGSRIDNLDFPMSRSDTPAYPPLLLHSHGQSSPAVAVHGIL